MPRASTRASKYPEHVGNIRALMITRRDLVGLGAVSALAAGCEAIGLKATIVSTTTVNGQTTTKVREAKNWDEFEKAMGEVATDFSDVAKKVGATTAELAKKLVDVPPQGQVEIGQLAPTLKPYEGDVRYDYLKVARMKPDAEYSFKYVQIGMPEYDRFFKASAEMYATMYQLVETGRHVHLASFSLKGQDAPAGLKNGEQKIKKADVESALADMGKGASPEVAEGVEKLKVLWGTTAELGVGLVGKVSETAQAGAALVTSAPTQILNPKLALHLDLIVKGLKQSVGMVKDTGALLGSVVA